MISKAPPLCSLPYLRASLIAPSLASAPELAKNTWSKQLLSTRLGKFQADVVVVGWARRDQELCLRGNGFRHHRWCMAKAVHRPALDEIEVTLAGVVPEVGAFAPDEHGLRARGD